jgi:alkylhydroperoxidase family enzyme
MFLTPAMTSPTVKRIPLIGVHGSTTISADTAHLRIPESVEAWKYLPALDKGRTDALPEWARALAKTLPYTTSALLELDHLHRARSPLEPILRGQLRWVAAHANGCRYSEAYAAADLRRAGMDGTDIRKLAEDWTALPAKTRAALRFAERLSRDGSSITDTEVEQLISQFGEGQVVAMVLLLAYANFQDRMILALGLPLEADGPLPPLDLRFARLPLGASRARRGAQRETELPRGAWEREKEASKQPDEENPRITGIQELLAKQRARRSRISLPAANSETPRWGLVCRTYQPELTDAWAACTHAFSDEANQDPLFEQHVFWLVTHDINCFY